MKDNSCKPSSYKNAAYLGSTTDITSLRSLPTGSSRSISTCHFESKYGIAQNGTIGKMPNSINSFDMQKGPGMAR